MASPDGDSPARAARRSSAVQICEWLSIMAWIQTNAVAAAPDFCPICRNYSRKSNRPATFASIERCAIAGRSPRRSCGGETIRDYAVGRGGVVTATIYKICDRELWQEAERLGVFRGAPVDAQDGFIHFSTAGQVAETAARYFAGAADLVLVAVDGRPAGTGVEMGAVARRGAVSPSLWRRFRSMRWSGPSRCRSAATAGMCFRRRCRDRAARSLDPAAAASARSGRRAPAGHSRAQDPAVSSSSCPTIRGWRCGRSG